MADYRQIGSRSETAIGASQSAPERTAERLSSLLRTELSERLCSAEIGGCRIAAAETPIGSRSAVSAETLIGASRQPLQRTAERLGRQPQTAADRRPARRLRDCQRGSSGHEPRRQSIRTERGAAAQTELAAAARLPDPPLMVSERRNPAVSADPPPTIFCPGAIRIKGF